MTSIRPNENDHPHNHPTPADEGQANPAAASVEESAEIELPTSQSHVADDQMTDGVSVRPNKETNS